MVEKFKASGSGIFSEDVLCSALGHRLLTSEEVFIVFFLGLRRMT